MSDPKQNAMESVISTFLSLSTSERMKLCTTVYLHHPQFAAELHQLHLIHAAEEKEEDSGAEGAVRPKGANPPLQRKLKPLTGHRFTAQYR